ncbi:MAG: SufD family Fe-S cluster assembly protein, partial [Candidatus Paceibacteria bacterium]
SRLNTKAVLKDYSFINYDDRIRVELGARQCRGEQHLEALLFSERAKLYTIPNLEIHNQEVQSKHGVSIRYLNPEWIFYLQSRGIGWEDACDLIEEGFFAFPEPKKFTA